MPEVESSSTEFELVKAIKTSDNHAFKEFCRIYYEPLYRFLWRKTRDEQTSLDLVQELFLNIWKHRKNLDESRSVKPYLYRSANNLAINHLKKKAVRQSYFVATPSAGLQSRPDGKREFQEYLDDVLQDLPEDQRIVFILNKFEGFKYAEIAETLQISIKTVESRMSKALKHLREKLRHLLSLLPFIYFSSEIIRVLERFTCSL